MQNSEHSMNNGAPMKIGRHVKKRQSTLKAPKTLLQTRASKGDTVWTIPEQTIRELSPIPTRGRPGHHLLLEVLGMRMKAAERTPQTMDLEPPLRILLGGKLDLGISCVCVYVFCRVCCLRVSKVLYKKTLNSTVFSSRFRDLGFGVWVQD